MKLEIQLKIENANSRLDLIEIYIDDARKYHNILVIILFVGHSAKILHKHCLKVARYSFSGSIRPKFERKLRRHKQRFGKINTTVVLNKDETLL